MEKRNTGTEKRFRPRFEDLDSQTHSLFQRRRTWLALSFFNLGRDSYPTEHNGLFTGIKTNKHLMSCRFEGLFHLYEIHSGI